MKLSSHKNRATQFELCMTPMIDCVFLLLIFFMSTTTFVTAERQLDPSIAVQRATGTDAASNLEQAIVEIVRGRDGFVYRIGTRELTDKQELTDFLEKFGNQSETARVRVADEAPCWMAAAAIQACKDANYIRVTYEPYDES